MNISPLPPTYRSSAVPGEWGIESLREIHCGTKVLSTFESLMIWRPILVQVF